MSTPRVGKAPTHYLVPLKRDLDALALWIMARAPGCGVADVVVRLRGCQSAMDYGVAGVKLVRLLREVPCRCPTWEEDGHLSNCDRIAAMHWQSKMANRWGLHFSTAVKGSDGLPRQIKELKRHEVVTHDPGDPRVLPLRRTGTGPG